ncbi:MULTISPECIES: endopeptidase La [Chitinophagaceae]
MYKKKFFDASDGEHEFLPIIPINENDADNDKDLVIPDNIGILPLRNTVLFPGVVIPITVGRDKSIEAVNDANRGEKLIGVIAQKSMNVEEPTPEDLCAVGTVARIVKLIKMPDGGTTVIIQGKKRFALKEMTQEMPYFRADIQVLEDETVPNNEQFDALMGSIKESAGQIIQMTPNMPQEASLILRNIENPAFLINFVSSNLNNELGEKQAMLEEGNLQRRAEALIALLQKELQFVELKNKVTNKARVEIDKQQKEYFLQQQLKSIKEELEGGDANSKEIKNLRQKAEAKKWPQAAKEMFDSDVEKLERMNPSTPDYSVTYNHIDLLLNLPWDEVTEDNYDLVNAQKVLDKDHFGMKKIKERILEYLAVLKLKGDLKSPILCFVGPPGIGKTSLGKSIARAIGRKYTRLSLGGVHDESEIRGHRKTYIGAMPGRILQNLTKVKSSNPVMILDEIDKLGSDYKGDPSSAMLEVLDPEQNGTFYDNYLELEYDLSKVLFIATANSLKDIQPALRDRLEIIDLSGYAIEEKVMIAKKFLLPKEKDAHGLRKVTVKISDKVLEKLIQNYTRESGVRELDRQLASLMRKLAKEYAIHGAIKPTVTEIDLETLLGPAIYSNDIYQDIHIPGVAVGLAWTYVGGDILFIESLLSEGKGELKLTGNLGDVMKESAITALSYLKGHATEIGIDPKYFETKNIHIHVPEGATPKDGPSAGITMLSALTSAFTGRALRPYLAMTGEITLRGQVLPVGGIKEKILAAKRAGLKEIVLCEKNEKDIKEIEKEYIKGLRFHFVRTMDEVLDIALNKKK